MQSGIGIDKVIKIAVILDEIPNIENHYNELHENVQQPFSAEI
jgi:hypothetical protein